MDRIMRALGAGILSFGISLSAPLFAAEVKTVAVALAELPRVYRLDGVAEATQRSTVSAQTGGRVVGISFDVDDYVKAGDVIVQLDDSVQQADVRRAAANLRAASSQRRDADKEFTRIRGVFAKDAVSKSAMDKATAARSQARAAEQAAEASLHKAKQQLEYTQIKAPYTGIVTERLIEMGETAAAGRPVMSGLSLDQMRISVDVPQNLVASIRDQRKAQALIDGKWVKADEVRVFPIADPRSDTFKVRLQLPPGIENVFPGMYVKVGFVSGSEKQLVVPLSSVVLRSEVVAVYVVNDAGRVFFRHIRMGSPAGPDHVSVLSGLSEGELVATDPVAAGIALKSQRKAQVSDE